MGYVGHSFPFAQQSPFHPFSGQMIGGYAGGGLSPVQQTLQLLQIVPQQLQQLQALQQQQLFLLQQLLQLVPTQLQQLQQLVQFAPQQVQHSQQWQPSGPTISGPFGFALIPQAQGQASGYVM
jgi:hypothetical protein